MNISTLLEIIDTEVSDAKYSGTFKTSPKSVRQPNQLGRGYFSTVVKDRNDPHMVKKYNSDFSIPEYKPEDPFYRYAEYVHDNNLHENPYFPRIYKHRKIEDKDGKTLHSYQIEKLEPMTRVSMEEYEYLFNKMFVDGDKLFSIWKRDTSWETSQISGILEALIIDSNSDKHIKDPQLKSAITYMREFISTKCVDGGLWVCGIDLHDENIMVRRTPVGLQVVITDPVS